MKISKLFHWLYALVMFLPILVFIPNVFYFAFNEHAQLSNSEPVVNIETSITYDYEFTTNEPITINDFIDGNLYYCESMSFNGSDYPEDDYYSISVYKCNYIEMPDNQYTQLIDFYFESDGTGGSYLQFYFYQYNIVVSLNYGDNYVSFYVDSVYIEGVYFSMDSSSVADKLAFYNNYSSDLSASDWNIINSATANSTYTIDYEDTSITGAVSNGWNQVWELPIFSWTHNTFFSAPFNYISGLFGFTSTNSISYCLSYWFSISIIWLVFDVMIYVPMLVHRWLDKASLS